MICERRWRLATFLLLLAACHSDPLVGTWTSGEFGTTDADGAAAVVVDTFTFRANNAFDLHQIGGYATGCVLTIDADGTYEESASTDANGDPQAGFAYTLIAGTEQLGQCRDPGQDRPSQALAAADITANSHSFTYVINDPGTIMTISRTDGTAETSTEILDKE